MIFGQCPILCNGSQVIFPGAMLDLDTGVWMPDNRAEWVTKWFCKQQPNIAFFPLFFPDPTDRGGAVLVVEDRSEEKHGKKECLLIRVGPDAVVRNRLVLPDLLSPHTIRFARMERNGVLILDEYLIHPDSRITSDKRLLKSSHFFLAGEGEVREVPSWVFQEKRWTDPDDCNVLYIDDESAILRYVEHPERYPDNWDWYVGFRVVTPQRVIYDALSVKSLVMPDGFWVVANNHYRLLTFGLRGTILKEVNLESLGARSVYELAGNFHRDGRVVVVVGRDRNGYESSWLLFLRHDGEELKIFQGTFQPHRWADVGWLRVLIGSKLVTVVPHRGTSSPKTFFGVPMVAVRWGSRIFIHLESQWERVVAIFPEEKTVSAVRFHYNPHCALIQTDKRTLLLLPQGDPEHAERMTLESEIEDIEETEGGFLVKARLCDRVFIPNPTAVSSDFEIVKL